MKFKRYLSLLLVLTLLMFASCSKSFDAESNGSGAAPMEPGSGAVTEDVADSAAALPVNQKLIRKICLTAETEALDTLLTQVNEKVASLGGYTEAREFYNYSANNRRATLTIRIPAENLDQFTQVVEEKANVTSATETTEDITLTYVAVESRMQALETEQTRLLELLAGAENMTEILQIESRLSEVRAELEAVTSQLRVYDNQVSYGTIYLTLHEVKEYTEEAPEGFFARIGRGFKKSLRGLGKGIVEVVIFLAVASPYLVVIAVIIAGVVFVHKRCKRKKATKEKKEEPTEE